MRLLAPPTAALRRSADAVWTRVDDRIVISGPIQQKRIELSGIAAVLWELLENPVTIGELATSVESGYDIAKGVATRDIASFVDELLAEGLLCELGSG